MTLFQLLDVFNGSDGEATKALYVRLENLGPIGHVAVNLFRAQKCSDRAKVYRGGAPGQGSYRGLAYERKQWAMDNLCRVLGDQALNLSICWGWKRDPLQEFHAWVLYVDLPSGQVSFHTGARGVGPDYPGDWDGVTEVATGRILKLIESLFVEAKP